MSIAASGYCALSTKVRAMYGRRLQYSDFMHMASMPDISSVLDYLRQTSWAPAISQLDTLPWGRTNLEAILREQAREEYVRLLSFAPRGDKVLMSYPVLLAELEGILSALRRLKAGRLVEARPLPDRFLVHSKIDYNQLLHCTDFEGLALACTGTIYFTALQNLVAECTGQLPDYPITESLLYTVYYTYLFKTIKKHYSGATKSTLLSSLGTQIDLLNIISILRLKQYFPDEHNTLPYLFSFHHRLKTQELNQLAAAPNLTAAFALLQDTHYAAAFQQPHVKEVEDYYRHTTYTYHHRQLLNPVPSINTAISYLHLKDAETTALITLIESIGYGQPFDDSLVRLIGS